MSEYENKCKKELIVELKHCEQDQLEYEKEIADHQRKIAVEELAELIMTIQHVDRRKADWQDLAREIADVEIMITQLKLMTLTNKQYGKILNEKLDKLESYLN